MKKSGRAVDAVDVQVKGKNYVVDSDMREQVRSKMQRLQKYLDRLSVVEVELCEEKTRDTDHHHRVEVTAHVSGRTMRVETAHGEMSAAVDEAVDKLYRQLNRHKERMKAHHGVKPWALLPETEGEEVDEPPEPPQVAISRVRTIDAKPVFEDEAAEALQSADEGFLVFLNARNEQVNVVYRDADGALVLVQAPGA